jgi:hypothetical protein
LQSGDVAPPALEGIEPFINDTLGPQSVLGAALGPSRRLSEAAAGADEE